MYVYTWWSLLWRILCLCSWADAGLNSTFNSGINTTARSVAALYWIRTDVERTNNSNLYTLCVIYKFGQSTSQHQSRRGSEIAHSSGIHIFINLPKDPKSDLSQPHPFTIHPSSDQRYYQPQDSEAQYSRCSQHTH